MRLCAKCLLPESFPGITFDNQGVCNYCLDYRTITYFGERALEDIFSATHHHSEYDCIVPISGGRDSAFVLHQIVKRYRLRPLVFNYDNGFATDRAKQNIENAVKRLNVTLVTRRSRRDIQKNLLKENMKLNIKKSPLHVLKDLCNGCANGYKGGAFLLAKERGVPLVIFGSSKIEQSTYKKEIFGSIAPGVKEKLACAFGNPWDFVRRKYYNYLLEKEFPDYAEKTESESVKAVYFFDYIEWDENLITATIKQELGWVGHGEVTWRVDCKVHLLVDFLTYALCGYNEKDELYSKLIREGKIQKKDATSLLETMRDNEDHLANIAELLRNVGLDNNEIDSLIRTQSCVG